MLTTAPARLQLDNMSTVYNNIFTHLNLTPNTDCYRAGAVPNPYVYIWVCIYIYILWLSMTPKIVCYRAGAIQSSLFHIYIYSLSMIPR